LIYDYDIAVENSYNVIILKYSLDYFNDVESSYFIHNPKASPTLDTINELLDYYNYRKNWKRVFKLNRYKAILIYNFLCNFEIIKKK